MLIYLSKQSKFAERVAGKKGRIKKFSLREVGGGGWGGWVQLLHTLIDANNFLSSSPLHQSLLRKPLLRWYTCPKLSSVVFSDKVTVVRYVEDGSNSSDPTPGELLKIDKAGDMEFKD